MFVLGISRLSINDLLVFPAVSWTAMSLSEGKVFWFTSICDICAKRGR